MSMQTVLDGFAAAEGINTESDSQLAKHFADMQRTIDSQGTPPEQVRLELQRQANELGPYGLDRAISNRAALNNEASAHNRAMIKYYQRYCQLRRQKESASRS